jgi:hypothetical protein
MAAMKNRAFFLTSVPLVIGALVAQVVAVHFILLDLTNATFTFWQLIYPHTIFVPEVRTAPESFSWIVSLFLWGGLVLAIFSLASVVVSFRRRERGWRFVTITIRRRARAARHGLSSPLARLRST